MGHHSFKKYNLDDQRFICFATHYEFMRSDVVFLFCGTCGSVSVRVCPAVGCSLGLQEVTEDTVSH